MSIEPERRKLRLCVIGLGGGGFHWEAQRVIQAVSRPLELVLVFAGPKGGLIYWQSKDAVRSQYVVRSPSLTGDSKLNMLWGVLSNIWQALKIIRAERPDVILAVGTAQAVPFAVAAKLSGTQMWFVESVTRTLRPCRTTLWLQRFGLGSRIYYYWRTLKSQLPGAICMEDARE